MTHADYQRRFPGEPLTLQNLVMGFGGGPHGTEALYDAYFSGHVDEEVGNHIRHHTNPNTLANRATVRAMCKLADAADALRLFLEKRT